MGLQRATVSSPQSKFKDNVFARLKTLYEEDQQMRRWIRPIIHIAAIFVVGLTASSAIAAGGGIDTATVYFGMPDPGTDDPTEFQDHKLLPD